MSIKTHKRRKSSREHGKGMGSAGWGSRKKHKKSGHRGGKGMAGSGKRADQKTTLITKLYGHDYFGKKGVRAKTSKKEKSDTFNLKTIESNIENFVKRKIAKPISGGFEINLKKYKILGDGEIKKKLIINAKSASQSAINKVKMSGGEIILSKKA
mgnify:CR=1 FL=1